MGKKKLEKPKEVRIKNRRASYDYQLSQKFVAGLVITGAEVKSIRQGKASISEAYCLFVDGVLKIRGMHIAEFKNAGYIEQDPLRDKLLLLNAKELKKIKVKTTQDGLTLVPLELFFSDSGFAKVEIALAKGKKNYDKRESLKEKDVSRDMDRYR